ncbi:hypothetical protein LTR85_011781 [Meristemomyces frigidus]|nr:hypothetical protein LTR85_011781 [Meristemomyces frigidus]
MKLTLACLDPGALAAARSVELERFMQTLQPSVMIVHGYEGAKAVDAALLNTGANQLLSQIWTSLLELATQTPASAIGKHALLEAARTDDPDLWAYTLFTSGTSSGKPKGCPRHVTSMVHVIESHPWDFLSIKGKPPRFLLPTPNFWIIAPSFSFATWKGVGAIVMPPPALAGPNISGFLDAIVRHEVMSLLLIPVLLHLLVMDPTFSHRKMDSLGVVVIGAGIVTKSINAKACRAFSHGRICCAHGMTKMGGVIIWPLHHTPTDEIRCFGDIRPLGMPASGVRLRICEPGSDAVTKCGEPGEISFNAEATAKHYLDRVNEQSFFLDDSGRR